MAEMPYLASLPDYSPRIDNGGCVRKILGDWGFTGKYSLTVIIKT